jgi:hypothetical protein
MGVLVWVLVRWRRDEPVLERSGTALVPVPPPECYEAIADILTGWPEARSVLYFPHDGAIEVRTHSSKGGFGEHVAVRATGSDAGSLVTVSSRPVLWATVVDYGRNRGNVRVVLDAILAGCGGTIVDRPTGKG